MLIHDAVQDFLDYLFVINRSNETINGYRKDLKSLVNYLENQYNCALYLEDITINDLEAFLSYLGSCRKLSPKSRSRILYTLRSFWNYAADKKELSPKNIARSIETIKVPQKERTYLKDEEVKQLIQAINNKLVKLIVQTLFYTGMRISECLNLKVEDVDLNSEDRLIHIINGKGGKDRNIPINNKLYILLMDYVKNWRINTGSSYFFTTKRTGRVSPVYINQIIRETVIRLGWKKHVSAHIFRHSMATCLIRNGVDLPTVQKILGHSNLKVTSIYCHTDMSHMEKAMQVM
jgi:Site-specific recombinase XerD